MHFVDLIKWEKLDNVSDGILSKSITNEETLEKVYVNLEAIQAISVKGNGATELIFTRGGIILVKESPIEIMNKLCFDCILCARGK